MRPIATLLALIAVAIAGGAASSPPVTRSATATSQILAAEGLTPATESTTSTIGDLAGSCAINSFTAGTLVLMGDGTKKALAQVKVGDVVMAGDPQKGTERAEPVKAMIVGQGLKHLVRIHIDGDVVDATYNHPFWSVTNQEFEWAQDLKVGEHVLLADGRAPPIESIYKYDQTTTVYNLSIQGIHTFFVGASSVLVHNSCGGWRGTNMSDEESFAYHFDKHGAPAGMDEAQYDSAAQNWAAGPKGPGESVPLQDGTWGVRFRTPGGGPGGTLDWESNIITFWLH